MTRGQLRIYQVRVTGYGPADEASLAFRLARDLTEAMGDRLRTEPVPGGRCVIVTLAAAAVPVPAGRSL